MISPSTESALNTVLSRGGHIMAQTESAISMVSGLAILAIVVPLITVFALDLGAYLSSMAAQKFHQKFPKLASKDSDFLAPSVAFVFKMNSPGAIKDFFQQLSSFSLVPPMSGLWLKIADEEH